MYRGISWECWLSHFFKHLFGGVPIRYIIMFVRDTCVRVTHTIFFIKYCFLAKTYRDTYRIVTTVSRYVSYREVSVSLQPYEVLSTSGRNRLDFYNRSLKITSDQ